MSKKVAMLAKAVFYTRIVVEVDDDFDETKKDDIWFEDDIIDDELANEIATQTAHNIINSIDCGIYENIDEVTIDHEMPYGEGYMEDMYL